MAQHIDIAVCAHVSCWAILRHYSERFSQHREILIYDITKLAQQFDPGGLTPSFGLHILEAERVFQAAGSFPLIVVKQDKHDVKFYAQLLAYLESGFPLYVGMSSLKHAVVAAGYAWRPSGSKQPAASSHVWSQVDAIIAVDDNHLPYGCVFVGPLAASGGSSYTTEQFDSFIVPLPEKIYYSAEAIEAYSVALCQLLRPVFNLPADNELQRRYFITTISALRRYAREFQSQLGDELVNLFMLLKTAQFVWVVEYASVGQWEQGHVAARAIIDATASPRDPLPVWFAHDHDNAILFDRSKASMGATMLALKRPVGTPLGRMEQNLRPVKARP